MNLKFIDFPDKLRQILQENLTILDTKSLNKLVTNQDLQELDKIEVDQIKYWNTKKIGEVIFNGYD